LDFAKEITEPLGGGIKFVQGDMFNLPKDVGTFDLCYSIGVIEHFPEDMVLDAVRAHRTLSNKYVIIVVPSKYQDCGDDLLGDWVLYDIPALEKLCKRAGLKPIKRIAYGDVSSAIGRWMPPEIYNKLLKITSYAKTIGVVCKVI